MKRDEFRRLLIGGRNVIIDVLGQTLHIFSWSDQGFAVAEDHSDRLISFNSVDELLEQFKVKNMALADLTRWMRIRQVGTAMA